MLSCVPPADVELPPPMTARAAGRPLVPVWINGLGGLTAAVGDPVVEYVKWVPPEHARALGREVRRLTWLQGRHPAPRPLGHGTGPDGAWLATAVLAGESAVSPRWTADPHRAARARGAGLRRLHDAVPAAGCPFAWSVPRRVRRRIAEAVPDRRVALLAALADPPPIDRLVVCQGDPCLPNTLLHDDGTFAGHVDLGALGVADRWADLAVAAWSTVWNYGPGHEQAVYDGYGIARDARREAYYRLLWGDDPLA